MYKVSSVSAWPMSLDPADDSLSREVHKSGSLRRLAAQESNPAAPKLATRPGEAPLPVVESFPSVRSVISIY